MVYNVIGLMSGSSLDGLDIAYVELLDVAGEWSFKIKHAACVEYTRELKQHLKNAVNLSALQYQLLHTDFGHFIGSRVNDFIEKNKLHHQVHLVVSHGHTTFHLPSRRMTAQLGDGAAIAAETRLPVVSDLRALDVALGGQGAPIVPIGEKLLFPQVRFFLNIGGIANISVRPDNEHSMVAFDVCAANRILNMLAEEKQLLFDENGHIAASGNISNVLLQHLNDLPYYAQPYPKSLANDFGTGIVYPLIKSFPVSIQDALRTYVAHICFQVKSALSNFKSGGNNNTLLVTGGGAMNGFLIRQLSAHLGTIGIDVTLPEPEVIKYKEALVMALIGILRWREEYNVLKSVSGASGDSIGGALWLGTEA